MNEWGRYRAARAAKNAQTDLRGSAQSLSRLERSPGTRRSLRRQSKANAYTECSALTGLGVKDVFDEAVLAALLPRHQEVEKDLLRERVQASVRSLRRSSRGLGQSLSRQHSRSITSIREACLRSELGLGLADRIRAWASKTFTRAKRVKKRKETIIWWKRVKEGPKKKRDNHLVKKPSFYDDICEPVGSNCGLEWDLSRSIEQREIHIQNNIQTRWIKFLDI